MTQLPRPPQLARRLPRPRHGPDPADLIDGALPGAVGTAVRDALAGRPAAADVPEADLSGLPESVAGAVARALEAVTPQAVPAPAPGLAVEPAPWPDVVARAVAAAPAEPAPEAVRQRDLPRAPTAAEKYHYFGPQSRRFMIVQGSVSVGIAAGMLAFFARHAAVAVFVAPLLLHLIYAAVSLSTTTMRRRVSLITHRSRLAAWSPDRLQSVDVFLPSCGEPMEILRNTYRHVHSMRWGGPLRVLVLDDSARPQVAALALEFGFDYATRPNRGELKKAGNLRFGYQNSSGELIVILDADFCPAPDFLAELVPYFEDSDVGIVQSPQYFDSRQPRSWLQRAAGSVQEIFYRWVQPSRDAADGAICVGTCAIYRRSALAVSGGFAQIGHSEDVHTGMNLIKKGYRLRYVPVLVARGICPDTVESFLSQQYRWCAGSMSLLVDRGFHNSSLTLRQRLCFWTGFLYYITTALTLFTGPASAAAMLWMLPGQISPRRYLPLIAMSWLTFWMWNRITCSRWDLSVVRVQLLYSAAHALAIWHTLRGCTADWVPTGAAGGGAPMAVTVRRILLVWLTTFQLAIWSGVLRAALSYGWERFWLSTGLAGLTALIMVPVLRVCAHPDRPPQPAANAPPARARHALGPVPAYPAIDVRQPVRRPHGLPNHIAWPEGLAALTLYVLLLMVCTGFADPMLPWLARL